MDTKLHSEYRRYLRINTDLNLSIWCMDSINIYGIPWAADRYSPRYCSHGRASWTCAIFWNQRPPESFFRRQGSWTSLRVKSRTYGGCWRHCHPDCCKICVVWKAVWPLGTKWRPSCRPFEEASWLLRVTNGCEIQELSYSCSVR